MRLDFNDWLKGVEQFHRMFLIILLLSVSVSYAQFTSPCPSVFLYEPNTGNETNKWYGVIILQTDEALSGVYIHVVLDRPAKLLGNWFGESTSTDNIDFVIKRPTFKLLPGQREVVRFFIDYYAGSVPILESIRLNGRTICERSEPLTTTSTEPVLHISKLTPGNNNNNNNVNNNNNNKPNRKPSDTVNLNTNTNNNNNYNNVQDNYRPVDNRRTSTSRTTDFYSVDTNRRTTPTSHTTDYYSSGDTNRRTSTSRTNDYYPGDSSSSYDNTRTTEHNRLGGATVTPHHTNPNNHNNNNKPTQTDIFVENFGGNSNRPTTQNHNYNNNNNYDTNNRGRGGNNPGQSKRPIHSFINNGNANRHKKKQPIDQQTQTGGNGLSIGGDSESNDFYPGDFAVNHPQVTRPILTIADTLNSNAHRRNCGTVAQQASPFISHGHSTKIGQFPWHAALYHSQGANLKYICGGTLISENHVVTAAHCVTKLGTNVAVPPDSILIYLGKYNLKKFGQEVQDMEVSDVYVHPSYNVSSFFNDIAILRLARPPQLTNFVKPICLWEDDVELENVINKLGTVVGWGFDENRRPSQELMQAQMPIVATTTCIYSNREFFSQFTHENSYCAGFRNGTSVCNGDSGSGMIFPKQGTSGKDTVWQLRGLVSVGVALQGVGTCDTSHYVVFTDVAKYNSWIERILKK